MIKAICFDLDGVFFTPKGKNSFHNFLIEMCGDKELVDNLMYKSPEMSQLVRGQISQADFWNRVRQITGIELSDKEFAERWVKDYEVDEKVLESVKNAKRLGYKTCVCTNNNAIRLPILVEQYKLNELFDCIVSSHEVGFTKPDKKIFEALLDKLHVEAKELVYSDDNLERLAGARELGINVFQFHTFEQFVEELQKLGVDLENTNKFQK